VDSTLGLLMSESTVDQYDVDVTWSLYDYVIH